jgi:hypothetical protein
MVVQSNGDDSRSPARNSNPRLSRARRRLREGIAQMQARKSKTNCEEVSQFLDAYLDNELEAGKRFEQHLSRCRDCRTLLEQQRQFIDLFAASAAYYKAPSELRPECWGG